MKLICLLSWYDEDPDALEATVRDARACGVTHLFALDGAYAAYPNGTAESPSEQGDRILTVAQELGMQVEVAASETVWHGGEVEKRDTLFKWAAEEFQPTTDDWFLVLDADERVDRAVDLKPLLHSSDGDVWDTLVLEQDELTYGVIRNRWNRRAFRCLPGLHVHPRSHWHYLDGDGRILWGYNQIKAVHHLPIVLRNNSTSRGAERVHSRDAYYAERNTKKLENYEPDGCYACDRPWTSRINEMDLEPLPTQTIDLTMKRTLFCCDQHFAQVKQWNELRVQAKLAQLPPHLQAQIEQNLRAARVAKEPREGLDAKQQKAQDDFNNAKTLPERLAASAEIRRLRFERQLLDDRGVRRAPEPVA